MKTRNAPQPGAAVLAATLILLAPFAASAQSPPPGTPATPPPTAAATTPENLGDVVLVGQDRVIQESEIVNGDAVVVAGNLTIRGTVHGDAVCVAGRLTLGPKASVFGDLVSVGGNAEIDPAAKVMGSKVNVGVFPLDIVRHLKGAGGMNAAPRTNKGANPPKPIGLFALEIVFLAFLAFLGLLLTTFVPLRIERVVDHLTGDFPKSALLGLALMLLLPVALLVLAVTIIGIPLVPLLLLAVLLAGLAGYIALGMGLGRRLMGSRSAMRQILVGLVLLQAFALFGDVIGMAAGPGAPLTTLLGAIGTLIFVAGSFVGLGAVLYSRFGSRSLAQSALARSPGAPPPATTD